MSYSGQIPIYSQIIGGRGGHILGTGRTSVIAYRNESTGSLMRARPGTMDSHQHHQAVPTGGHKLDTYRRR